MNAYNLYIMLNDPERCYLIIPEFIQNSGDLMACDWKLVDLVSHLWRNNIPAKNPRIDNDGKCHIEFSPRYFKDYNPDFVTERNYDELNEHVKEICKEFNVYVNFGIIIENPVQFKQKGDDT